ncbi:MAG: T9SS type A sorting domain-containing protein, partial [Saprospiraceae bacterium]|nr:T9SS type A sorting domain-containing protein [Saprospiraceae bacterium]
DDISSVLSSVRLYPNPGNDVLQLEYLLEETSEVRIELIDGTGRQVRVLNSGVQNSGKQYLTLYPGVPAGVYWLRILTGKQVVLCRWVRM